eukprot:1100599-Pelagomonas_calceolata.AAC.1
MVAYSPRLWLMPKLRYPNPQDFREHSMNLLSEELKNCVACLGRQSPLANSLLPNHAFIGTDHNNDLKERGYRAVHAYEGSLAEA